MIFEHVVVGPMEVNCYILGSGQQGSAIIIDPGGSHRQIKGILDKYKLRPGIIINTHGHYDHIGSDDAFGVAVYVHSKDAPLLKDPMLNLSGFFALPYQVKSEIRTVEDGASIELEGIELEVLHVPGHTQGGIALLMKKPHAKKVFTGDTLFNSGIGRSDLAGGSEAQLLKSIKDKLLTLADDVTVYPGHGPSSTIGAEKRHNPYL
jgi:hydroxyacylglutathione hydrolase